ncbi:MAG: ATP-binding cassette domain-containing protein [Pseudonocardiaceae bacterium]|nr:ATP-binding cassette domain-containing protein [Pseudonocardiaceae bacterium]
MPTRPEPAAGAATVLDVADLRVHFELRGSFLGRLLGRDAGSVQAVDGVTLSLRHGEVLGLVGESGSGKTTLGRALLGLVRPTAGSVCYRGTDLAGLRQAQLRPLRQRIQMVFQDPGAALNPAMDIETAVGHPLRIHGLVRDRDELRDRVHDALRRVGLVPVERFASKYPAELSGGQQQRAVLARAIILGPELLVADEPVSMLDMSVRAKILELMLDLRRDLDLSCVYITHDLATAKFFCDRVAIMYLGRIVEIGPTERIFADPAHPYTRALLAAVPEPDPTRTLTRQLPRGEVPDGVDPPGGCSFHPRCPHAFAPCGWEGRDVRALLEQRWTALDEADYAAEQALFADLAELDVRGSRLRIRPAASRSAESIRALLEQVRVGDPDEPLWRGVRQVSVADGACVVDFVEGVDPNLGPVDEGAVACHLYDPAYR